MRSVPYFDPVCLHRVRPTRYPFVLESASIGEHGRCDIVMACPGESLVLTPDGLSASWKKTSEQTFLGALDRWWDSQRIHQDDSSLPFTGGWFVYLGYELAGQIEPSLNLPKAPHSLPVAQATRIPAACIADHHTKTAMIVVEAGYEHLLDEIEQDVQQSLTNDTQPQQERLVSYLDEAPGEAFVSAVEKTKAHIHQGDIYQANLSRDWIGRLSQDTRAIDIYARLRETNRSPFAAFAQIEGGFIVSSSPERLIKIQDGVIETRPIAGTRPRSEQKDQDKALLQELIQHPKERAEHIMLIDLERNDLGRVCEAGSVEVNEMMVLESYAKVHHIVSNIRGRLKESVTPGQAIAAVFPGGTITGCPKVRCMEIIAELEQRGRGPYTGSLGYLSHNGNLDLNILIRTISVTGRDLCLSAGAGIVADSEANAELRETRAKAKALLDALNVS